jgi:DNA-binding NtrC family response regulator
VLLDLALPGQSGLELLPQIKERQPELPVIMITAYGTVDTWSTPSAPARKTSSRSPGTTRSCWPTSARPSPATSAEEENPAAQAHPQAALQLLQHRGQERDHAEGLRPGGAGGAQPLHGADSGRERHRQGADRQGHPRQLAAPDKPFVPINTGAMPSELLESTLFGHVKGAFTSAIASKKGLFEVANGGTLFLDEIATMGMDTQAKILRVLQDRRFMHLGGIQEIQVDVRIIAATNIDLRKEVREGRFREDLFYRLNVISVDLPPLRARREDIPLLASTSSTSTPTRTAFEPRKLSADALRALMDYEWPGNVRELENSIERGVVLSSGPVIGSDLLPGHITGRSFQDALLEHNPNASLFDILEDIERRIIIEKLERCNWNQTEAAEQFHIPLSTLNQKIKRLNIEIRKKGRE